MGCMRAVDETNWYAGAWVVEVWSRRGCRRARLTGLAGHICSEDWPDRKALGLVLLLATSRNGSGDGRSWVEVEGVEAHPSTVVEVAEVRWPTEH